MKTDLFSEISSFSFIKDNTELMALSARVSTPVCDTAEKSSRTFVIVAFFVVVVVVVMVIEGCKCRQA